MRLIRPVKNNTEPLWDHRAATSVTFRPYMHGISLATVLDVSKEILQIFALRYFPDSVIPFVRAAFSHDPY